MRLQRVILGLSLALIACADDDDDAPGMLDGGSIDGAVPPTGDGGGADAEIDASLDGGDPSLCARYGGPANVELGIKQDVILALASDCAIGPHLYALPSNRLARLGDCMAIHAQELLGCPGVKYSGSRSPNGLLCGGGTPDAGAIVQSDLDALLRDVADGLRKAGVSERDITLVTPQLVEGELVQAVLETPTQTSCASDAGLDAGDLDATLPPLL